jgi:hypothetical protein
LLQRRFVTGDVLLWRRFVTETFCMETFCRGDVLCGDALYVHPIPDISLMRGPSSVVQGVSLTIKTKWCKDSIHTNYYSSLLMYR